MTRVRPTDRREIFWRAWLVRLTALAFIVQSVGLFLAPARPAPAIAAPAMAALQVHAMLMAPDCPHHHSQMDGRGDQGQGSSDSCPMCQTLGCALGGVLLPEFVFSRDERLIGLLVIPARHAAPDSPILLPPPARGPPVLV